VTTVVARVHAARQRLAARAAAGRRVLVAPQLAVCRLAAGAAAAPLQRAAAARPRVATALAGVPAARQLLAADAIAAEGAVGAGGAFLLCAALAAEHAHLVAGRAVPLVTHALARVPALQPPPADALAREPLLPAAPLHFLLAAVAAGVDHQGAGRAGARVAQEAAAVGAAARQGALAELAAGVRRQPPVGRLVGVGRRSNAEVG
jgi:hypothetical protein